MSASSLVLVGSPVAFAPIAFEYAIASSIYLCLLLKPSSKGNIFLLISSSAFKLLASCAVVTTNLNLLGLPNLPFLVIQLLNEITILSWAIRRRQEVAETVISALYTKKFKVLRTIGEICTIVIICGTGLAAPLLDCPCAFTILEIFALQYGVCNEVPATRAWGAVLIPQIRGLAFAISITAVSASMNGPSAMISGVSSRIRGLENEGVDRMGRDFEWKRKVRTVFSGLTIIVALLFLATYLLPGFRQCESDDLLDNPNNIGNVRMTYTLGPISSSLFNALLAIGQMFISDILFRSTASFYHEDPESEDDKTVEETGAPFSNGFESVRAAGSARTAGSVITAASVRTGGSVRAVGSVRTMTSARTIESAVPEIGSIDRLSIEPISGTALRRA